MGHVTLTAPGHVTLTGPGHGKAIKTIMKSMLYCKAY